MPLEKDLDSGSAHSFRLKVDGVVMPKVSEVSGLKLETAKFDMKQQTDAGKYIGRQMPGPRLCGEFVVTRGLTESKTVTDWLKVVMEGDLTGARKTASVEYLDYKGQTLKTYNFVNCWVRSVEVSAVKAGTGEPLQEKFTICYDEASVS